MQVYYGTQSAWYDMAASGTFTSYVQTYPGATYISGFFHHVKLTGLRPDTTYFYKWACCSTICLDILLIHEKAVHGPGGFQ